MGLWGRQEMIEKLGMEGAIYLIKLFPQLMDDPYTDWEIHHYLTSYQFIYNPEKNELVKRDNGTE